jgi:hypothetical protein
MTEKRMMMDEEEKISNPLLTDCNPRLYPIISQIHFVFHYFMSKKNDLRNRIQCESNPQYTVQSNATSNNPTDITANNAVQ